MRVHGSVLVLAAVLAGSLGNVPPAFAVLDAEILAITTNVYNCTTDVVFRVQDAGDYFVNVWDDGTFRTGAGGAVLAGGTSRVRITIGGPILEGASGIGLYVEDAAGPAAANGYDSEGSASPWSPNLGTSCMNKGKVFESIVVSEEFPTGTKLTLAASSGPGKPRKLSFLSKDPRLSLGRGPASADDPVLNGGSLRVRAEGGTAFDDTYTLDASGWKYRSPANPAQGYSFSGGDTIQKVLVKPGGQIKIEGKGNAFGHELTSDPVAVRVELRLGARRFCLRFGGKTSFAQDQSFSALKAPADELACPD
jgi:hypothetical protein